METAEHRATAALNRILRVLTRPVLLDAQPKLSHTSRWLLAHLDGNGPQRPGDLAQWQAVDKSTMTMQLRRLVTEGFVERRPDPDDRRAALMQITESGRRALQEAWAERLHCTSTVLDGWSDSEREELARVMDKLAVSLETYAAALIGRPEKPE